MAKTSQEVEKEFIASLKSLTSKDLKEWMTEIKNSSLSKRNDIINWLKKDHNFGHMYASLLMGIYTNNGKPVYGSDTELLATQFGENGDMRPLYEAFKKAVLEWDKHAAFVIKKMYVSVTKKREFATVNIKKGELRIGLDLGDMPFNEYVGKAKLSGPMPRISHMVVIRSEADINDKLFELMQTSDHRVNR